MDTARLATMLPIFVAELGRVRERLQALRLLLKDAEADHRKAPALRKSLEKALDEAPSRHFVPSWMRMIVRLGGRKLHAVEVRRRVRDILDNPDYEAHRKGILLEQVETEVQNLWNHLRNLDASLKPVMIEPETLPVGIAEIGVLFPPDMFADLEEFAREVGVLDRHLRTVTELAGQKANPKLAKLQTNGFDVFVWSDLLTGAKFVAVIYGVLRAWREIEDIRKVRAETARLDAEASEILDRVERQRQVAAKDAVVQGLISGAASEPSRMNELETAARHVVEYVEQRMRLNVTFEVRAAETSGGEDQAITRDTADSQPVAFIRESGHVMAQFEIDSPVALLTEKPDSEPGA